MDGGETHTHAAHSPKYFLEAAQETTALAALNDVADHNAEFLSDDPERDPRVLADRFEDNELALTTYVGPLEGDPAVEVFDGVVVPMSTLLAVELGEVLVHGYNIAGASGLHWPIAADHAALTVGGLLPILPYVIDPAKAAGFDARFAFRIRGGIEATFVFDNGTLHIEAAGGLNRSTVTSPSIPPPTSFSASTGSTRRSPPSKARSSPGADDPGSHSRWLHCSRPSERQAGPPRWHAPRSGHGGPATPTGGSHRGVAISADRAQPLLFGTNCALTVPPGGGRDYLRIIKGKGPSG